MTVMSSFIAVFLIFLLKLILGSMSGNFPLESCSTEEMDILFVITEVIKENITVKSFVDDISNNSTTSRVLFASVDDMFYDENSELNISSWSFNTTPTQYKFSETELGSNNYDSVQTILEIKIQLIKRLFSEMLGVRQNVTHVAVIFMQGKDHPLDEIRNIPQILQQQDTHIKIFILITLHRHLDKPIHLTDTLIINVNNPETFLNEHILIMAICKQCPNDWFKFEYHYGIDDFSCYHLYKSIEKMDWFYEMGELDSDMKFVVIETEDELRFLQSTLSSYFKQHVNTNKYLNNSSQLLFRVYIGLRRQGSEVLKRFKWEYKDIPLVINKWLKGAPSGHSKNCVLWKFVWKYHVEMTNVSNNDGYFIDGWINVDCHKPFSVYIFREIVFPRKLEKTLRINPASKTSIDQALNKGDIIKLDDNIVSVSAHVESQRAQEYLIEKGINHLPVFDCGEDARYPRYISYMYLCDDVGHCSNRQDETVCKFELFELDSTIDETFHVTDTCTGVECCDGRCLPVQFVNDGEIDCEVCDNNYSSFKNDEIQIINKYLKRNTTCALICNRDTCVTFQQLNDGKKDCLEALTDDGQNENLDETIGKLERADTCYNLLGHVIWAPKCVYVKDHYGALIGCRDVSHLKNCKEFECPEGYFKCPNSYCIPQHYVLDKTPDCPSGVDEVKYLFDPCTGNFKCLKSEMCLHPDLVCDGHPECPHQDDEMDCHYKICSIGFNCVSGTATALYTSVRFDDILTMFRVKKIRYLELSGVHIPMNFISADLTTIKELKLSKCNLTRFPLFNEGCAFYSLDISYNHIQTFDGNIKKLFRPFKYLYYLNVSYNHELINVKNIQMTFLEVLDLSHTGLTYLDDSVHRLSKLRYLDLSYTSILFDRYKEILLTNFNLQTLDLRGVYIKHFHVDLFKGLTINTNVYTDYFEICCPQIRGKSIPSEMCHAPDIAISSCFDLIGVSVQRILLWLVAVLAILGNLTVILFRVIWDKSVFATGYGLFVTNLGISDFIMGVYLCIIAGADYKYRGVYVVYDKIWRESLVCKLAGFLVTLSIETSTYFIFLITLDRFLIMKFPFGQIRFSNITKTIALLMSWIIGLILALIPVVFKFEIYSSNAMCLGLPLTTQRDNGWGFSFAVFIVHNFLLFLVIAYGQKAIFSAMAENRISKTESSSSSRLAKDILVAKQLSLVALSNFLCWFPVGLMGLLTLGGHEMNNEAYAWTTVVVLPINSAANPIIYTIPAIMDKWEKFKHGDISHR